MPRSPDSRPSLRAVAIAIALTALRRPQATHGIALLRGCRRDCSQARRAQLEFAVAGLRPGPIYDCHGKHLLRFPCIRLRRIIRRSSNSDAPNYPQIVSDLAESWERVAGPPHLHISACGPNVLFSRRLEADFGRC